jgi:hypothetical protein
MSYSNGIVNAPVSVYDIRDAVSHSSGDLGTLISNGSINKWAKYKPVRNQSIDTVTGQWDYNNNRWLTSATWWKGNGGCGLSVQAFTEFGNSLTTPGTFMYKLINGQLPWNYERPGGGSQQPFRYADFAQYNRNAIQPYGEIGATTIYVTQNWTAQIDWEITYVDDLNLRLSDIIVSGHALTEFYLGLILYDSSTWHVFISTVKFAAGESISIPLSNISQGMLKTWNCMPFFTLTRDTGSTGLFVSMADTTPVQITLTRDGSVYLAMPWGQWNQAGTQVEYEIIVNNDTSTSRTFSSIVVTIYGGSYVGTDLGHVTITNAYCAANQRSYFTGTIQANKTGYSSYWIVVSIPGTTIEQKYSQVEDYGGMID